MQNRKIEPCGVALASDNEALADVILEIQDYILKSQTFILIQKKTSLQLIMLRLIAVNAAINAFVRAASIREDLLNDLNGLYESALNEITTDLCKSLMGFGAHCVITGNIKVFTEFAFNLIVFTLANNELAGQSKGYATGEKLREMFNGKILGNHEVKKLVTATSRSKFKKYTQRIILSDLDFQNEYWQHFSLKMNKIMGDIKNGNYSSLYLPKSSAPERVPHWDVFITERTRALVGFYVKRNYDLFADKKQVESCGEYALGEANTEIKKQIRHEKFVTLPEILPDTPDMPARLQDDDDVPYCELLQRKYGRRIDFADIKTIFKLRAERYTYAEIAQEINWSEKSIQNLIKDFKNTTPIKADAKKLISLKIQEAETIPCRACGYDNFNGLIPGQRCPQCGEIADKIVLSKSTVCKKCNTGFHKGALPHECPFCKSPLETGN